MRKSHVVQSRIVQLCSYTTVLSDYMVLFCTFVRYLHAKQYVNDYIHSFLLSFDKRFVEFLVYRSQYGCIYEWVLTMYLLKQCFRLINMPYWQHVCFIKKILTKPFFSVFLLSGQWFTIITECYAWRHFVYSFFFTNYKS